ncbi:MAG: carbohydrate-binding family 9-like protein [Clostridia bacterium]|nr:carbohydrate-binding family 9-like protein [Clostridia bacterium]
MKDLVYSAPLFADRGSVRMDAVPCAAIDRFHWEQPGFARPRSAAQFYGVAGVGLCARLQSDESPLRCEVAQRDGPVWTDSCLELFLAPVPGDPRYINVEVNPAGVFLSQFGAVREGRVFLAALTALAPEVKAFRADGVWGCEIFLPDALIAALFATDYHTAAGTLRGNIYKCADGSAAPHYGACFPVDDAALGFHNPACFGRIELRPFQP